MAKHQSGCRKEGTALERSTRFRVVADDGRSQLCPEALRPKTSAANASCRGVLVEGQDESPRGPSAMSDRRAASTRAAVGIDPGVDRWDRNDGRDRPQLDLERPDLPAVAATVAAQRVLVARAVTDTPHPHRPSACTCVAPGDPWDLHVNGDKVVVDVMTGAVVAVGADAPVACHSPIGASPWCRCCGVPRLRTKS